MKPTQPETDCKGIGVLFVCMGNICRSPTAHGVFQKLVEEQSLHHVISVDSAGTYAYHTGDPPDSRARAAAANRGYDLSKIRARRVTASDFLKFDYLLAMDNENKRDLLERCKENEKARIRLFLDFSVNLKTTEVPDPYYGGSNDFEVALDLIEEASHGLLEHIKAKHPLGENKSFFK